VSESFIGVSKSATTSYNPENMVGKRNGSAINNTTTAHRQRRGGRSQSIAGSHGCTALQWPLSGAGPPRAQTHRDRAND